MRTMIVLLCTQATLLAGEVGQRERLLVEVESLQVTTPLVKLVITRQVGMSRLHVWTPGDDASWRPSRSPASTWRRS